MKADTLTLKALFQKDVRYVIPTFQRPYVWTQEDQWEALWDDLRNVAEWYLDELQATEGNNVLAQERAKSHFMGAVVLQQRPTPTAEIETRTVIEFATFARGWLATYPEAKDLKRSTVEGYRLIIGKHLLPVFGSSKLDGIDAEALGGYLTMKRRQGLAPRTLNRHLNLLNSMLTAALRRGLVRSNPVPLVDRPREPRRRWRILSPAEIGRVEQALDELIAEASGEEQAWREQARTIWLVLMGAGLRRCELLGLRWHSVHLADPDGAFLRVSETYVRAGIDTPKSDAGERTVALGQRIAAELFEHRGRTAFAGDDERVFCSPTKGTPFDVARYAATFRLALTKAGITDYVRPFHDGRHTSITNAAAAGTPPAALMARAGHSDFKTTQGYIDLAGETFREEADRLERRIWGNVKPDQAESTGLGTPHGGRIEGSDRAAPTISPLEVASTR